MSDIRCASPTLTFPIQAVRRCDEPAFAPIRQILIARPRLNTTRANTLAKLFEEIHRKSDSTPELSMGLDSAISVPKRNREDLLTDGSKDEPKLSTAFRAVKPAKKTKIIE